MKHHIRWLEILHLKRVLEGYALFFYAKAH